MTRRRIAALLDAAGATEATLRVRAATRSPWLTVITYHRVSSNPAAQPWDPGVIDASPEEFEEQVATMQRYFSVVGMDDLLNYLQGAPLPNNPVMITFDDGYLDCHDVVLPILRKHGAKAVFFISTNYVTERRIFWWDRVGYLIKNAKHDRITLTYPNRQVFLLKSEPEFSRRRLLRLIKSEYGLDLDRFLEELTAAAGVEWSPELERSWADELIMNWDHVRALRRAGMEIASHTRTHRILQTVVPEELDSELSGARTDLEEQLGERISGVSYPVGHSISSYPEIKARVAAAGYQIGFSNMTGVTRLGSDLDPFDLRRISVEYGLPISYFRALLAFPTLAELAA